MITTLSVKVLPFGSSNIEIKGQETVKFDKEEFPPAYGEPIATSQIIREITFNGAEFVIPKTTAGIM